MLHFHLTAVKFTVFLQLLLLLLSSSIAKKKDSVNEFLDNEKKKLSTKGVTCSLKKITTKSLINLRLVKEADKVIPCILNEIDGGKQTDGLLWTSLGTLYAKKGSSSQANTCFKQALKLSGKISQFIKEWSFIGPFVIGKMELDGDPLEAYGGIYNVSKYRYQKDIKFYSELVNGGEIKWKTYTQTSSNDIVKISPQNINWNDLVSSLGSMGITEWQGWVVGEFFVNEKDQNIIIQCLGVHTVYVNDIPLTGDVYHRDQFWSSIHLSPGIHSLYIRLRTKVAASFKCSIKIAPAAVDVLSPHYVPDLVDGYLVGRHIPLPIANYHHSKFIKITKITIVDQSAGEMLEMDIKDSVSIAPGQIVPVIIELKTEAENSKIISVCSDIEVEVKISTSEGVLSRLLQLRCRKSDESFLFTFVDHDGSIQHAAAIQPIGGCVTSECPVLLTLHGTTVPPQNQADSYKRMVGDKFLFGVDGMWVLAPTRHGAHNWEGPGALTAMSAVDNLVSVVSTHTWMKYKPNPQQLIYAGHSMGGHGSWHLATHYPDRGLALLSLAGWIKKEEYGDSNLFFKHDISTSHTDPAIKFVMEACIAENDADRHISNIQDLPVLTRIGANDRTVHPFFMRRMYRLLMENQINVSYTELLGKEHWWWDTKNTNDGGVVNDQQLRDFTLRYSASTPQGACSSKGGDCEESTDNKYVSHQKQFTLTTYNPALGDGLNGIRILQQITPFRLSQIQGKIDNGEVMLTTTNVAKFAIKEPPIRKIYWKDQKLSVDGVEVSKTDLVKLLSDDSVCLHRIKAQEDTEDEKHIIEWFKLVNEKNKLVRKEADLIYATRQKDLEDEQHNIDQRVRPLMSIPDSEKTDEERKKEEFLIQKHLDLVNQRNLIVDSQEEDRIRYELEDKKIAEVLALKVMKMGTVHNTFNESIDNQARPSSKSTGSWVVGKILDGDSKSRMSEAYGPARRIAEKPFVIVIGTHGNDTVTQYIQRFAVYIANLFFLTSDTTAPIYKDSEIKLDAIENMNVILIGKPSENSLTSSFLTNIPIEYDGKKFSLEDCQFGDQRVGVMALAPHGSKNLALILMGNSIKGLLDAVSLATPTIPPMTRSPFSNLLPDYVITGPDFGLKGPGGFHCTGFWGNKWEYRTDISSCVCSIR